MKVETSVRIPIFLSYGLHLLVLVSLLFFSIGTGTASEDQVELTPRERTWLNENPQNITLYYNVEFPPIEFSSQEGEFIGIGAQVISRIEEILEITFIKTPSDDWNEHLKALESGESAIAPTIVRTPQREEYAFFTTPYAESPVVLITPNTVEGRLTIDDLRDLRVGVVSGYATETYLQDLSLINPFEVVPVENVLEGLMAVSFGEIHVFVENLAVAAYYIQERSIPNLRVAGETDYLFAWSIGVSREYPLLYSSIQKALDTISTEELKRIQSEWITLETPSTLSEELIELLKLGGVFFFLLLFFLTMITFLLKKRLNERVMDLRESKAQYQRLVENVPVIVCQLRMDPDGFISFLYMSASLDSMTGLNSKRVMEDANTLLDSIHPQDRVTLEESILQSARTNKPLQTIFRYENKGWKWMELSSTPENLADGSTLWDGFLQEITEGKEREEELKESNKRLQIVMDSIDAFVYIADMETYELLYVNEYGRRSWKEELIGLPCYQGLQGLDSPCSFCTNEKLLDSEGRPADLYQWEFQNKVNHRWYAIIDRAIPWIDGRIVRMEIATDITEIKRAQEIIEAKNKELEQIVYVASHDLRSPLVNVDGYRREIEYSIEDFIKIIHRLPIEEEDVQRLNQIIIPDMREALYHIKNSAQQMDALLKGLLKLSRIGRRALTIKPLDMDDLIHRLISSVEFQVKESGTEIEVTRLPSCLGDEVQVTQVFSNLVNNALKFLHPHRRGRIRITGTREKESTIYSVSDNGIGIEPRHQEKIFELFHRLDPNNKDGEGLGLTIVRQILSRLNGEIWVQSQLDKGSSFYVRLPYAPLEDESSSQ